MFKIEWPSLPREVVEQAREGLEKLLNAKPPSGDIVKGKIYVTKLSLGSVAPSLEILELPDVSDTSFKGLFQLGYAGDIEITLRTRIQLNTLAANTRGYSAEARHTLGVLAADRPFTMPTVISVKDLRLNGIVAVSVSGPSVSVSFKNDILESVAVESTFDEFASARAKFQRAIEGALRAALETAVPKALSEAASSALAKQLEKRRANATTGDDGSSSNPSSSSLPSTASTASTPGAGSSASVADGGGEGVIHIS